MKIRKLVDSTNMRGWFLMKVRLMTIYNYPNLRNFNHVKKGFWSVFGMEPFLPNRAQRLDIHSLMLNLMRNRLMMNTCLSCIRFKSYVQKTSEK